MGLDFTIYKKKLTESCEEAYRVPDFESERELAYGRKSWELVYALVPEFNEVYNSIQDGEPWVDPIVDMEAWNHLMSMLSPIGDKLDEIWNAFHIYENLPDDFPEMVLTDDKKRLIAEYELWYNSTFNDTPTLGFQFSVGYMSSFWRADEEVRKAILDPEWEVRASVSY